MVTLVQKCQFKYISSADLVPGRVLHSTVDMIIFN